MLVFWRDLLEENVAIESAESVEEDRSLGPGGSLDAPPRVRPEVMAHRAKGALRRKSPDVVERLQGRCSPAAADLGNWRAGERRGWDFRLAPHSSNYSYENKSRRGGAESSPRGSAPKAPFLLGAQ
jgi:hypothetical protein